MFLILGGKELLVFVDNTRVLKSKVAVPRTRGWLCLTSQASCQKRSQDLEAESGAWGRGFTVEVQQL